MKIPIYTALLAITETAYLWAYWSVFGIDPFPYIGLDQLATHALGALLILALTSLLGVFFRAGFAKERNPKEEFKFRISEDWYMILGSIGFIFLGFYSSLIHSYLGFLSILVIIGSHKVAKSDLLTGLSDNLETRRTLVLGLYYIPAMALLTGLSFALQTIQADSRVDWVASDAYSEITGTIHVGRLGTNEAFYLKEEDRTYLVPSSDLKGFSIGNKKKEDANKTSLTTLEASPSKSLGISVRQN